MSDSGWQASGPADAQGGEPAGAPSRLPLGGGATTALQSDSTYPVTCALDAPLEMPNLQPIHQLPARHTPPLRTRAVRDRRLRSTRSSPGSRSSPAAVRRKAPANNIAAFQRYWYRVVIFQYFMTKQYPEFKTVPGYADPGGFPARIDITPATSYDRMQVILRFLYVIPLYLYGIYVAIMMLIGLLIGFFSVLTGGKWNPQWRRTVFNAITWIMRVNCWYLLLVDEYPGFTFES